MKKGVEKIMNKTKQREWIFFKGKESWTTHNGSDENILVHMWWLQNAQGKYREGKNSHT
jgi:hypothetical protein